MAFVERGTVRGRSIEFSRPLSLPEGTEVEVRIEPLDEDAPTNDTLDPERLVDFPFFGMWADRAEMQDSATWVEQEREKWQRRTTQSG
jgi:hypothetical protein